MITKQMEAVKMDDKTAYKIIGERAAELAKTPEVQAKMVEMIRNGATKEEAEKWLYTCAIGTLIGVQNQ
jgi:hypothetical protein